MVLSLVLVSFETHAQNASPAFPTTIPNDLGTPLEAVVTTPSGSYETHLIPALQSHLHNFVSRRGNPITGLVVVEVATGHILSLIEGLPPKKWGGSEHTTLHPHFPAASLFKTVVTSAAIEVASIGAEDPIGLMGGCAKVRATGRWLQTDVHGSKFAMNLERAFGHSCNGFFAKLAVNHIGLGAVVSYAYKFGWDQILPADFHVPKSPIHAPDPKKASVQTVGKFAAGFGEVGSTVMHAAWRALVVANRGSAKPLKLFKHSPLIKDSHQVIEKTTSDQLLGIMKATVQGGTASSAFRHGRLRQYRYKVGGKTGTLTGSNPEGLTTWFTGIYPIDDPKIVVAAVTVIEDLWIFKAHNLAAEAIAKWDEIEKQQTIARTGHPRGQATN